VKRLPVAALAGVALALVLVGCSGPDRPGDPVPEDAGDRLSG
jgi:hypothetical protein